MTIRASICLAAITGILGLFSIGSAHADSRLGAALKALAPIENNITRVGHYRHHGRRCCRHRDEDREDRYRDRDDDYDHSWLRHWRHRYVHRDRHRRCCRYVRRHHRRYVRPFPTFGRNYEIYTYRRIPAAGPRTDVQWVYGRYRGYYYPYPHYEGAWRDFNY